MAISKNSNRFLMGIASSKEESLPERSYKNIGKYSNLTVAGS